MSFNVKKRLKGFKLCRTCKSRPLGTTNKSGLCLGCYEDLSHQISGLRAKIKRATANNIKMEKQIVELRKQRSPPNE
jgi:hypothetical protein